MQTGIPSLPNRIATISPASPTPTLIQCSPSDPATTDEVRFLYTNAEGLASKRNELYATLATHCAHVICITESHYSSDSPDDFDLLPDYSCFRADRLRRKKGGAVICVKNTHNPTLLDSCNSPAGDWEAVWCSMDMGSRNHLKIGCCYKSPDLNPQSHDLFINMLRTHIPGNQSAVLLVGDFNYPNINWNCQASNYLANRPEDHFLSVVDDNYLTQLITFPTRSRGTQLPSLLGLLLVSDEITINEIRSSAPLGKSDHIVLSWSLPLPRTSVNHEEPRPCYQKADFELISSLLDSTNWTNELEHLKCTGAWELLSGSLTTIRKHYIPHQAPQKTHNSQPWMHAGIKNLLNRKKKKWRVYKSFPTPANWENYKQARNDLTRTIVSAKQVFEEKLAWRSKHNKKLLYSYFRSKRTSELLVEPA